MEVSGFIDQNDDRRSNDVVSAEILLLQSPVQSWEDIHTYILSHPDEAQHRYSGNESLLQLALKARECRENTNSTITNQSSSTDTSLDGRILLDKSNVLPVEKRSRISRINVLQAITNADPYGIHWQDREGRTPLHTACSSGQSSDILQWLIDEESEKKGFKHNSHPNSTVRTHFPMGSLALHSIAACSVFEEAEIDDSVTRNIIALSEFLNFLKNSPIQCKATPNILCAYASTTTIWQSNPNAIWRKDYQGESPLHSAASWGNIGSVFSILIGTTKCDPPESVHQNETMPRPTLAALALNDRNKTPLDCACERVVFLSVHDNERYLNGNQNERNEKINFRVSDVREDQVDHIEGFCVDGEVSIHNVRESSASSARRMSRVDTNMDRISILKTSLSSSRSPILGCSSYSRSSSSSPFAVTGGKFGLEVGRDPLRSSFIFTRSPVHPLLGLKDFDEGGNEEFAKIEVLARAAYGCFQPGCKPDSQKYSKRLASTPHTHHMTLDSLPIEGNTVFCLVHAVIHLRCPPEVVWHAGSKYPHEILMKDETGRVPLFVACEQLISNLAKQKKVVVVNLAQSVSRSFRPTSVDQEASFNHHQVSLMVEIISMLLYSPVFGSREMASVENNDGRLPLHIILESIPWTVDTEGEDDWDGCSPCSNQLCMTQSMLIQSLIDAYPQALVVRDGKTGLFPFMLAAVPFTPFSPTTASERSTLDTIYSLILEAPVVISICLGTQ